LNSDATKFATNLHSDKFLQKNNGGGEGVDQYYTLSFDYRFESYNDEVWFAHAVPYTYTEMSRKLKGQCEEHPEIMRAEMLCNTLAGMPVPLITITENVDSYITYAE
jgi:hypothetical protein